MDLVVMLIVVKLSLWKIRYVNDMVGVLFDIGESYMNLYRLGLEVIFREVKIGCIV